MNEESAIAGDIVLDISVHELLKSIGIQMAVLSHELAFTDAAYGTEWCLETSERVATISELCHIFFEERSEILRDVKIILPSHITGFVTVNPIIGSSHTGKDAPNGTSSPSADLGDLPF